MKYSVKDINPEKKKKTKVFTVPESIGFPSLLDNNLKENLITRASQFIEKKNFSEAINCYKVFLDKGFNDEKIFNDYASLLAIQGKTEKAKKIYKQGLIYYQKSHLLYSSLGNILRETGDNIEAEKCLRKAIQLNPNIAYDYVNLASILVAQNKLKEAEKCLLKSIRLKPENSKFYRNLGLVLYLMNKNKKAKLFLEKTLNIAPNDSKAHELLGKVLIKLNDSKNAKSVISKAINLGSKSAENYLNYAILLAKEKQLNEAELYTRKAINLNPNFVEAFSSLGSILFEKGKLKEAESSARKAIILRPEFAEAHLNLGNILFQQEKIKEAYLHTKQALKFKNNFAEGYFLIARCLSEFRKIEESEKAVKKALELNPKLTYAYCLLANILKDKGELLHAQEIYKKAFQCDSSRIDIISAILEVSSKLSDFKSVNQFLPELNSLGIDPQDIVSPLMIAHLEDDPKNYQIRATNFYNSSFKRSSSLITYTKKEKINIGYFSADLWNHPIMHVMARVFELHDRNKFNIFIYSFGLEDKYTERLKSTNCCYRQIKDLSNLEAVELARKDQLDIAIDLMGYTTNHRMPMFSYRMAPIQIHHFGTTTGSNKMDYLMADKNLIPDDLTKYYTEKIIYMPHSFFPFDDTKEIEENKFSKQDMALPSDTFIFAAFHSNYKITTKEINSWSRILSKTNNTVLWLSKTNSEAQKNLINAFKENGIEEKRIVFTKKMTEHLDHLSRHCCADLFLDTFYFNGHSTSLDALWTGLPVVTLMGKGLFARVSGSYLIQLELEELIAYTIDQYENIIISLVNDPLKLKQIKNKLNKQKLINPLFNSEKYTENLEKKFVNIIKQLEEES